MYYIKAYALLIKRILIGGKMPFHSREFASVSEQALPENAPYRFNGKWNTAKAIAAGKCRLHWLR